MRKPTIWDCNQVQYKPACTVTEAGWKLEISDLRRRGIVLCVVKRKVLIRCAVTAQLICVFVFAKAKIWFSHDAAHLIYDKLFPDRYNFYPTCWLFSTALVVSR